LLSTITPEETAPVHHIIPDQALLEFACSRQFHAERRCDDCRRALLGHLIEAEETAAVFFKIRHLNEVYSLPNVTHVIMPEAWFKVHPEYPGRGVAVRGCPKKIRMVLSGQALG
jgi:hypothetical protein